MAVRKRGKGWMVDVYVDGNRQRQMIPNARLEKQAKKAEIKLQDELFDNKFNARKEVPFLADFIDEHFLPWSRANKRSWYHDGWRSASLKAFFKGKRLNEITPMLIEKFKSKEREAKTQRGEKQSPAAVNRKLELLSRILSMAVDFEMIETNPCRRVRRFSLNNRRERYLSREEEERLMTMLVGRRAYLRPIVILALNTGMRRGEILNLEWWQVDFSSNRLIVTKTKSGKPRHIPMNQIVQETMRELKPVAKKKYVFESPKKEGHPLAEPKKAFNSALRDAGIENFRFHDLRHTAGTRLAEMGVDAFTIKDILGHASIQTTMIYVHATDEGKRQAVHALERYGNAHGHKLGTNEKEQIE